MGFEEFLAKIKEFQIAILDFIDDDDDDTEDINTKKLQKISELAQNYKICEDKNELKTLLSLITQISNDHHRSSFFYDKIIKILQLFVDGIKKNFTNNEIFHIFESNKRLLLFFLEEKILVFNELIAKKVCEEEYQQNNYTKYFHKEIKPFNESIRSRKLSKENQIIFNQYQKDGENDKIICKLIREDLIEDFIIYINQNSIQLNSQIKQSFFETNSYLLGKDPTLIEYATFFGSIRIFEYLSSDVELTPILWIFAIHGNNPEIIRHLENNKVKPLSYEQCLIEAIKCHHNNIVNYIKDNYLSDENFEEYSINFLRYYNFAYVEKEAIFDKRILSLNDSLFFIFFFEENQDFDINEANDCISKINSFLMKKFNFI